ncbi:MAG: hypothetical protein ABSH25_20580 [Syntrophorhabdales bacterium]|jgi:hypothetical protein
MTEREFQTNVREAEGFLNLSEGTDTKFWSGYLRGLLQEGRAYGQSPEDETGDQRDEKSRHKGRSNTHGARRVMVPTATRFLFLALESSPEFCAKAPLKKNNLFPDPLKKGR